MDTWHIRRGSWNGCDLSDPRNIALARTMAPAYLRIGGTSADNVTYDMSMPPEDPPYIPSSRGDDTPDAQIIPHATLNATDWDAVNAFASAAGWEIVFGLNIFDGWEDGDRSWNATRSIALMNYTKTKGYPVVGWEIGNEPNLKHKYLDASEVAKAFGSLYEEMSNIYESTGEGTRESPWLVGPDVTKGQGEFLGSVLTEMPSPGVDIVTWHHYYVAGAGHDTTACDFMEVDFLNAYCDFAEESQEVFTNYTTQRNTGRGTQLWMGETSGAGASTGGSSAVISSFIGVFWYADKLGFAASTGHSVVARQTWLEARGNLHDPAPEFWFALLWKRLVGRGVLSVSKTSGSTTTRSYAHCSSDGSVTAIILNLANSSEVVSWNSGVVESPLEEYHLTSWPSPGDLWSSALAVNGQLANLTETGDVPEFVPHSNSNDTVTVAGLSVVFVIFPEGSVTNCAVDIIV